MAWAPSTAPAAPKAQQLPAALALALDVSDCSGVSTLLQSSSLGSVVAGLTAARLAADDLPLLIRGAGVGGTLQARLWGELVERSVAEHVECHRAPRVSLLGPTPLDVGLERREPAGLAHHLVVRSPAPKQLPESLLRLYVVGGESECGVHRGHQGHQGRQRFCFWE